tara:strand:- start:337 stop:1761 length:1425 start_codon:yes stop_codon:yes gene_type:complete
MSEPYKHPHMREGLEIDKEAIAKSIEVTEAFIKASDPVDTEDKMSKITYTAKICRTEDMCRACDTSIGTDQIYISKYNRDEGWYNAYCVACAGTNIRDTKEFFDMTDDCVYVSETIVESKELRDELIPLVHDKIKLKIIEVKEMTEKEVEDYDKREGLDALFGDRTMRAEEDTPDEEVEEVEEEVEVIPTVMSKLTGSVDLPEEFKFADNKVFYTMLRNIYRGKSILVTGPSGCGKSSLGKILADITNKPYYAFNFGDTMNPAAKLLGDTKYSTEEGTWFKPSRFVTALMDKKGAFIMMDEVTRDRTGDLGNILMPVLDGQKYLALDESDDADTVQIDDGAFFYATANIGREYLGAAHDLDRAWKDRFTGGIYELEYLPQKKEEELLLVRVAGLSEDNAFRITDFAKRVRDLYAAEELSTAVSTRMCLATAEFVVDGMSLIEALKQVCLPFYPVVAGDDSERVRVIQTIQSMGE